MLVNDNFSCYIAEYLTDIEKIIVLIDIQNFANAFVLADIYVSMVSYTHSIAPKGFFVALVSTTVETDNPEKELQPGLDLLGPIHEK